LQRQSPIYMFLKLRIQIVFVNNTRLFALVLLMLIVFSTYAGIDNKEKNKVDLLLRSAERFPQGSISQFNFSKKAYDQSADIEYYAGKAKASLILGDYFQFKGELDKASDFYFEASNFIEKYGKNVDRCRLYISLSEHYRSVAGYNRGIINLIKALEIAKSLNEKKYLVNIYDRMASILFEQKRFRKSMFIAKTGLQYIGSDSSQFSSLYNVIGSAYRELNQYDSAEYCLNIAMDYALHLRKEEMLINVYYNYGRLYEMKGDFKRALVYSQKGYILADKLNVLVFKRMLSRILAESNYHLGNYRQAYEFQKINYKYIGEYQNGINKYVVSEAETSNRLELQNKEIIEQRKVLVFISIVMTLFVFFMSIYLIEKRNKQKLLQLNNHSLEEKNKIIQEQNAELEDLNKTKDSFFSIIAHDLRSPLGSFKSITELLLDKEEDLSESDKNELIEEMKNSSGMLYNLLENLLIWARSQRGVINFAPKAVNLKSLLLEVNNVFKSAVEHKKINITILISEDVEVMADENMLSTIFRNLLSNAIKFSVKGGEIVVKTMMSDVQNDKVEISVSDYGIGMSEKVLGSLFKLDDLTSTLGTSGEKGSGLGLILVKDFVEDHGSELIVESKVNHGSIFRFYLPLVNA